MLLPLMLTLWTGLAAARKPVPPAPPPPPPAVQAIPSAAPAAPTTVFVVRHAEKGEGDNPSLTAAGLARAEGLARALRSAGVDAVYSTDLCRTAQTADPTARLFDVPIQVLPLAGAELSGCVPALSQPLARLPAPSAEEALLPELAARIRALPAGSAVLVVGHSNTVPEVVAALGAPSLCPELLPLDEEGRCWLPHGAYDDVFVVTMPPQGPASALRLRLGEPTD